jgi:general secretion pathway protein G
MTTFSSPENPSRLRRIARRVVRHPLVADEKGMTLLEILVVMVIIGLLATLGSVQLMGYLGRAKTDTAKLKLQELSTAIDLFRIDVGRVPTTDEGVTALVEAPEGVASWAGPYIRKKGALNDPWGRPYRYASPAEKGEYDIVSLGADGKPGGEGENRDVATSDDR